MGSGSCGGSGAGTGGPVLCFGKITLAVVGWVVAFREERKLLLRFAGGLK